PFCNKSRISFKYRVCSRRCDQIKTGHNIMNIPTTIYRKNNNEPANISMSAPLLFNSFSEKIKRDAQRRADKPKPERVVHEIRIDHERDADESRFQVLRFFPVHENRRADQA